MSLDGAKKSLETFYEKRDSRGMLIHSKNDDGTVTVYRIEKLPMVITQAHVEEKNPTVTEEEEEEATQGGKKSRKSRKSRKTRKSRKLKKPKKPKKSRKVRKLRKGKKSYKKH